MIRSKPLTRFFLLHALQLRSDLTSLAPLLQLAKQFDPVLVVDVCSFGVEDSSTARRASLTRGLINVALAQEL